MGHVEKVMGGMLILFGVLIATNTVSLIAQWMLDTFPMFTRFG
jgi:cytochrome c-type biogenesis protein